MSYIVCHSNLVYVYVNYISHGKNKGPMNYNKYHGAFYLKKHVFHEHVKEGKRWDLLAQKNQGDGNQQETTKKKEEISLLL
jgi:hypothetical protein